MSVKPRLLHNLSILIAQLMPLNKLMHLQLQSIVMQIFLSYNPVLQTMKYFKFLSLIDFDEFGIKLIFFIEIV